MKHLINFGVGGVLGIVLSTAGVTVSMWQFWAVVILVGIYGVVREAYA